MISSSPNNNSDDKKNIVNHSCDLVKDIKSNLAIIYLWTDLEFSRQVNRVWNCCLILKNVQVIKWKLNTKMLFVQNICWFMVYCGGIFAMTGDHICHHEERLISLRKYFWLLINLN